MVYKRNIYHNGKKFRSYYYGGEKSANQAKYISGLSKKTLIILLGLVFFAGLVLAIPQTFNIHTPKGHENPKEGRELLQCLQAGGKLTDSGGSSLSGVYNMALSPYVLGSVMGCLGDFSDGKIYKDITHINIDMSPSDPSGSLDDFFLIGFTMNEPCQMLLRNLPGGYNG